MSEDETVPAAEGDGSVRVDAVADERPTPPDPLPASASSGGPEAPEPTPTVTEASASFSHPAGTAAPNPAPSGGAEASPLERPEVQVGLAFAGGLVVATILKRLGR